MKPPALSMLAVALLATSLITAGCRTGPSPEPGAETRAPSRATGAPQALGPDVRRTGRPGWVAVRARVTASEDEAPAQARQRARTKAHRAAIEYVAGVRVRSNLLSLETTGSDGRGGLIQLLSTVSSEALVVDEVIRSSRMTMLPHGGYRVDLEAEVKVLAPRRSDERAAFETELVLEGEGRYRDGDPLALAVRASRDARILVVVVGDDQATLLLPNRHQPDTRIAAGQWLRFPSARLLERGVRLEARVAEGRERSEEVVLAIAVRGDIALEDAFPASSGPFRSAPRERMPLALSALLSPLAELDTGDWAFDQEALRITAR